MIGDREMNGAVESPDSRVKGRLAGRQRQFEYLLTTAARLSEKEDPSSGVAPVLGVAWRSLSLGA